MKSKYDAILSTELLASPLGIGETTYRIPCPKCSRKGSFGVTRQEAGFIYHCFRNACGHKGFLSTIPNDLVSKYEKKLPKKQVYYPNEQREVPPDMLTALEKKYGLSSGFFRDSTRDIRSGRLVMPIVDRFSRTIGHNLRTMTNQVPKTLFDFVNKDSPRLAYYMRKELDGEVWLVEDMFSAMRLSRYVNAVAILGTHLDEEQIAELHKDFDTIYLALDADATVKAMKLHKKYYWAFKNFYVVRLSKDVKDMTEVELLDLLRQYGKEITSGTNSEQRGV